MIASAAQVRKSSQQWLTRHNWKGSCIS